MSNGSIKHLYFDWLLKKVDMHRYGHMNKVLMHLFMRQFEYSIPRDGNRYEDGIDLRYRFGEEKGIDERIIASELDIFPCSVLEMLTALACRIETAITEDPDIGDRSGVWFEKMLRNSGLWIKDSQYDISRVDDILDLVLERKYDSDGHGAFFTTKRHIGDMRTAELWYQAMWYLDEQMKYI